MSAGIPSEATAIDHIASLSDMLRQLRDADPGFRVFGSMQHGYRLGFSLSERELATFESANGIRLPEDYRRFLSAVGNGGAGPYDGLEPLGTFGRNLSKPFPFIAATDTLTEEELGRLPDRDEYSGVIEFCHQGCAIYSYLVVNGPTYGTLWDGGEDFYPTRLTFAVWYRRWLERALRALANERLVPRLQVGMSLAEVLAAVGGEWKARPALGRSVQYLEADGFPAQLELDAQDVVIKVNRWPFI